MTAPRVALLAVSDLFFVARIRTAAAHLGVEAEVTTPDRLAAACGARRPDLAIVDLHAAGALDGIRALRSDPALGGVRVVGFYSHVDDSLRRDALAAGADETLPRSAFTARLAALLEGGG